METQTIEQKESHHHEIVRGGVSAFTTRLIGMGLNYVFAILVARGYGAAGSGIYSLSQSVLNFFGSIGKLGSDTLMTRFTAQYVPQGKWGWIKDLYNKSMFVSLPVSIALTILVYFLSPWIATAIFTKPEMTNYFRLSSIGIIPITVFAISNGGLRGLKKINEYTFLQNASYYVFGIIIITAFLLFTKTLYAPVITLILFVTITSALSVYWWVKYSKYRTTKVESGLAFNEKFWIGVSLFVASFASLIRGYTDTFILGRYATIEEVGIYRNAFRIATIARIALTAILVPAAPKFAELFSQGKMKELGKSAQFATKIIFWTSAPILIVIMCFPKLIMSVFGQKFTEGAVPLMILAFGQFINAATGPVSNILTMTGKQRLNRDLMVSATILAIILDLIFIPKYGALAAACVNTLGVIIMNLVPMFLIKKYYGFYTLDFKDLFNIHPKTFVKDLKKAVRREKKKKGGGESSSNAVDETQNTE